MKFHLLKTAQIPLLVFGLACPALAADVCAPVGWCTQSGGTTGGGNTAPVTVNNLANLQTQAGSGNAAVIYVQGTMGAGVGTRVVVASNKTIFGLPGATLVGGFDIKNANNVILRNMKVQGPGAVDVDGVDCITVQNSTHVWLDHLEVWDGQDGNMDIVNGSNYICVSWVKFRYTSASVEHQFCNLVGNSDSATSDRGLLKVTWLKNWWDAGCRERMPRLRFGQNHVVNNLFACAGNGHCVRAGLEADLLVESNVFNGVNLPIDLYNNDFTGVTSRNNSCVGCNGNMAGPGGAFTPPYTMTIEAVGGIEAEIRSRAGATLSSPNCGGAQANTSTPTRTSTRTQTRTPTRTSTPAPFTPTRTATLTSTRTSTPVPSTPTRTSTPTVTRTSTSSSTRTSTPVPFTSTPTRTGTATTTRTNTPVPPSATFTTTPSRTNTSVPATSTSTPSRTMTSTASVSRTATSSATQTSTASTTSTRSVTASPTSTNTLALTPTSSNTPQASTLTATRTPTSSATQTSTRSMTSSATSTASRTSTAAASATSSQSSTTTSTTTSVPSTATPTVTVTSTGTLPPTASSTQTSTAQQTSTATSSASRTATSSATFTASQTQTSTNTLANTATPTATSVNTLTASPTASRTSTSSRTMTQTSTRTSTPSASTTASSTPTLIQTSSATFTVTPSPTVTPTASPSSTATPRAGATPILSSNPSNGDPINVLPQNFTGVSPITVQIFTDKFLCVQTKGYGTIPMGWVTLELTDYQGQPLANGLYYVRVTTKDGWAAAKLVILR